ncbi:phosphotransferase [Frigidibacter sp. MR17.14]|uniref:phosphotransferase n=1 Tax=Frigidibacter sp. MR17.14 TaxID=3126509 RepID=UPI003012B934
MPIAAWGVAAPLVPLPGGHRNLVFRTVGLTRDLVFKTTRRSEAALRWLGPVQAAACQAGLAVPALIPARSGSLSCAGWTCEPLLEGIVADPVKTRGLEAALGRFHDLTARMAQRPGFRSSRALLGCRSGGDVDLDAMPVAVVALCRAAWRSVAGARCAAIHGDVSRSNLLRCPDGRIALLDWDEARRDLRGFDTLACGTAAPGLVRAALAWEVACCWRAEPARARRLARKLAVVSRAEPGSSRALRPRSATAARS